ncbi:MAG: von Willebrand factor, type [candidate division NC10 bacterium]|jgi:Ca-activated chloride channel family protein|nr:von Willebrand factor, type [candidate division NC10 bacterium]
MPITRYSQYTGKWWDSLDLEDLFGELGDYLLQSGFQNRFMDEYLDEDGDGRDLQDLYRAILQALASGGQIRYEDIEDWLEGEESEGKKQLDQILKALLERMLEEGYITLPGQEAERSEATPQGYVAGSNAESGAVKFELTNKAIDFLGYRTLRDLLSSLGRSSVGRHDTQELSTGVEASEAPKPYEFGDVLNLDIPGTLLRAVRREGLASPLLLDYDDLLVHQAEYHSSCATVMMLDCSHSMILYGEDRFTPAKRVALALAHLIRAQYPGDTLNVVLFHDSAEEVPVGQLARVTVGPYHTNTQQGLRLARRILSRQRKDMRQIIMITDGKPSAMTMPDGRVYKNAMGLDPWILTETFREVTECRRSGILINTFMLARDYDLVAFVQKVSEICRGKAYFTTPMTLGRYLLMDFMTKRVRTVH